MSSIIAAAWNNASAQANRAYTSTTNWMKNHPTTVRVAGAVATVGLLALSVYGVSCAHRKWGEACEAAGKEYARRFVNDAKLALLEAKGKISTKTPEGKAAYAELERIIQNIYKSFPA